MDGRDGGRDLVTSSTGVDATSSGAATTTVLAFPKNAPFPADAGYADDGSEQMILNQVEYSTVNTVADTIAIEHTATSSPWIDNSRASYFPVKLKCEVFALCRPEVLVKCPRILQDLNEDL